MKYNFKEAQLPKNFLKEFTQKVENKINPSGFITIAGMPGVGISFFARFFAANRDNVVYLDIANLAKVTKHEFFVLLANELGIKKVPKEDQEILDLYKRKITEILKTKKEIIFIFNRFDNLKENITPELLNNLRILRLGFADKISMIFISHTPLHVKYKDSIEGASLDGFSNILYFEKFSQKDLESLIKIQSKELFKAIKIKKDAYDLSGGHFQLFKLILKSKQQNNYFADSFISLSLKSIYNNLSYQQKKLLQKIAFRKKIKTVDQDLLDLGVLNKKNLSFEIFTPLFSNYIKANSRLKLPFKEERLFKILKNNEGKIVHKENLFNLLWSDSEQDEATDWALNALIYRLRKNPYFLASGYIIENNKKIGYTLLKN